MQETRTNILQLLCAMRYCNFVLLGPFSPKEYWTDAYVSSSPKPCSDENAPDTSDLSGTSTVRAQFSFSFLNDAPSHIVHAL